MSSRAELASGFFRKLVGASKTEEGALERLRVDEPPSLEHLSLTRDELSLAQETYRKASRGEELDGAQQFALEAIIIPDRRPAIDIVRGDYAWVLHPDWTNLNDDTTRGTLKRVFRSIGRLEVAGFPGVPYGGTAFVVGEGLLITNRHVAELFARGLGRKASFITGRGSAVDFARDPEEDVAHQLHVRDIVLIHPYWDAAVLKVDGLNQGAHPALSFIGKPISDNEGKNIAVVGYPAFDPRNAVEVQNRVFNGKYYVKRLLPGKSGARRSIKSFENTVPAFTHDASTLGGNSGSAVIDIESGDVVGLHFAGVYLDANFAVPGWQLARDSRVVDAGVRFVEKSVDEQITREWWRALDSGSEGTPGDSAPARVISTQNVPRPDGAITVTIPLEITVRLGEPRPGVAAPAGRESPAQETVASSGGDDDPAEPGSKELSETADFETARVLANLGASRDSEAITQFPDVATEAPGAAVRLVIDIGAAKAFLAANINADPRVRYGLGAKARHGARPGKDFTAIDCSGFVRELIWRSTTPSFNFPDGSVNQHDWIREKGFSKSSPGDATASDGAVRIAFLCPQDSPSRIGHVVVIHNGATLESHGGVGPDSRRWNLAGWQTKAYVYVLTPSA